MPDFNITNHGSLFTLLPNTPEAEDWCANNINPEATTIGGAIAVEPRYIEAIVEAILEEGMTIQ